MLTLTIQKEIGLNTDRRYVNLLDENEPRASSKTISGNKPEISVQTIKIIALGQININSQRNKFKQLCEFCKDNLEVLLITETKLDSAFPRAQFHIPGYCSPCRLDRNSHGGGSLLYVSEDLPSKLLIKSFEEELELNIR